MKMLSALLGMVTGAAVTVLGVGSAAAADFSFRGTFAQDDDVQLFDFSVGAASTAILRTYGYAGGIQADGTAISAGGFDPILTLFDGRGNLLFENDDDLLGNVPRDTTTGRAYDSFLEANLAAGDYTIAISQFGNFSNGPTIANGFSQQGNSNFTTNFFNCTASAFCDFPGNSRTNQWAFDILGINSLPLVEADADQQPPNQPPVVPPPVPPVPPTTTTPPSPPTVPPIDIPNDNVASVPEPATITAVVLLGMGAVVRRRRQ